jgi:hypothetical protein
MIIGISGKINSGKDTIGKIIQYLTCETTDGLSFEEINKKYNQLNFNSVTNWQIVKFADALKDIVCILTGCTREQLEDINFKNSKLSNEWNIINTIPNIKELGFKNAKSIKSYTYRELLQILGTNLLRNQLHENIWINALFSKYKCSSKDKECSSINSINCNYYNCEISGLPNWIITDVRFLNELNAIKERNGITIRVNRLSNYNNEKLYISEHLSETSLDNANFDYIINNNSTIENLIIKVKEILIKEKIICL